MSYREQRGDPVGVRPGTNTGYGGRPETIESVFYLYRITGDPIWQVRAHAGPDCQSRKPICRTQDRAWQMFTSWVGSTITTSGFAGLHNVNLARPSQRDSQESFVFAETLKYYYLAFSDPDFLSLDDFVFNTEACVRRSRPGRLPCG